MPDLRRDPITGRWVIVNVESPIKPGGFDEEQHEKKGGVCPFCLGNEKMTPPEIIAYRKKDTAPDTPGWRVRTVPNKYPALQIEGDLNKRGIGVYDITNGVGAHEVIIETPDHNKEMKDVSVKELEEIITMYKQRSIDLEKDKRFRYILIFKNYGKSAGASLEHPHSQLIALPVIPKRVKEELVGSLNYFDYRDRCIFCDMIKQEKEDIKRIIDENEGYIAFTPYVSRFPFEVWIIPKNHESDFTEIENKEIPNLSKILKNSLYRIDKVLTDPSYNFIIHTSPVEDKGSPYYHWHIEIMPKLVRTAGFEWGSGFYICLTPPEMAAEYLRGVK